MGRKRHRHPVFDSSDALLDGHVTAELDLHGYRADEARAAVRAFLESWGRRHPGAVVSVITGRGKGSADGPVLLGLVKTLLQGELRSLIAEWDLDDAGGGYKVRLR